MDLFYNLIKIISLYLLIFLIFFCIAAAKNNEQVQRSNFSLFEIFFKFYVVFFTICQYNVFFTICQYNVFFTICQYNVFFTICQYKSFSADLFNYHTIYIYPTCRLKSSPQKLYGRRHDLVGCYKISTSRMVLDLSPYK